MLKIHKNGLNCGTPLGWNQNKPELQTENDSEVTCELLVDNFSYELPHSTDIILHLKHQHYEDF